MTITSAGDVAISSGSGIQLNANNEGSVIQINANGGSSSVSVNVNAGDLGLNAANMYMTGNNEIQMNSGTIGLASGADITATVGNNFNIINSAGNGSVVLQSASGQTGNISVDEGTQEFVFKADGTSSAVMRSATSVSMQALHTDGIVSMLVGAGEAIVEASADGAGSGRIYLKSESGGGSAPVSITIDGMNGRVVNVEGQLVPTEGIVDVNWSAGSANQVLTAGSGGSLKWTSLPAVWGSFLNTNAQLLGTANLTSFATFDTDVAATGCTRLPSSYEIQVNQSCSKLRVQAIVNATTATANTNFRVWLRKNAANVANTASTTSVKAVGDRELIVREWYVSAIAGDKFTVCLQADQSTAQTVSNTAGGSGANTYPASPSIMMTLQGFP